MFSKTMVWGSVASELRICGGALIFLGLAATCVRGQTLTTLASFNGSNGNAPCAGLTLSGNTLYGTTYYGGVGWDGYGNSGGGTVFSLPVSGGTPTVLASFNGSNAEHPHAGLTFSGNALYGTTQFGGANNDGTVFTLPIVGGTPTVLASFNGSNGVGPYAGLTIGGNTLYGTTSSGGANSDGTVFSVPLSGGTPTVLASFNGKNGQYPYSNLTLSGSTLYGATQWGGTNGYGTVFSLPVSGGTPTVLASFNGNNGEYPTYGALMLSGSTLYGTTYEGGNGYGTVYSVPLSGGTPTVLASFNGSDGAYPLAGLTLSGNTLYGTTSYGGAGWDGSPYSLSGTVFSLPISGGTPTVLASFGSGNGSQPWSGVTLIGNTLYGTTYYGGINRCGTVFALSLNNYYAWNIAGGGSWATAGNWTPAGPPDGAGNTADFSQQTLTSNATVTLDGSHTIGNLIFGDAGNAYNWTLAAGSGGTLTLQVSTGMPAITVNNQTTTITVVLSGSQGLTKGGPGTLVLAASNAYSGPTTISQGKLVVDGWLTNSAVTVNGGTLGGTGSLTSVTVYSGGNLAPGDPQGVLHLSGNLNLASGAAMDYDLDGISTDNEVLMPSGQLILSDQQFSDFNFTALAGFGEGTYILIDAGSISGSLGANTSGMIGVYLATVAVQGNDLVLNVVPEPSALVLLAAGALGLLGYGWRRRKAVKRNTQPAAFNQPQEDGPAILSFPCRWAGTNHEHF